MKKRENFLFQRLDTKIIIVYHCINRMIQSEVDELSFDQNVPIYLQLVEKIRFCIVSGNLSPGERVLSVREWALQEKVNPNTMQKALTALEEEGLILTERTNGKFVTNDLELIQACKQREANRIADEFFERMKRIGFARENALKCLEEMKGEDA